MVDGSSRMWDERYSSSELVWSAEPNEFVVEYVGNLPPGRMLDLGGGEGRHALWFAQQGWLAENSDFSAVAIDKFLRSAEMLSVSDKVVGTVADATTPQSCTTAPVDLVVMDYLQLSREQLKQAIITAASHLAPQGTLFGVWHARDNLEHGYGGPPDPEVLPTVSELEQASGVAAPLVDVWGLSIREAATATDCGWNDRERFLCVAPATP